MPRSIHQQAIKVMSRAVIEPIATPSDIESALERYMEELKFEGVLEWCRSLAALDASEDLLHHAVARVVQVFHKLAWLA